VNENKAIADFALCHFLAGIFFGFVFWRPFTSDNFGENIPKSI
jgi:hypothetical protein